MSDRDWRSMLFEPVPDSADPVRDAADPAARHDRRRRSGRLRDSGGRVRVNLTPMIDVVFQLLIFFVCTAQSLEGERIFRVDVPPMEAGATQGVAPDPFNIPEPPLRVLVRSTAEGAIVAIDPALASIGSIDALHRFMSESRRGSSAESNGLFAADHPILIDPDRDCSWEDTVGVFNALLRAGYQHVGFAGARTSDAPNDSRL